MLQKYKIFFGEHTINIIRNENISEINKDLLVIVSKDSDIQEVIMTLKNGLKEDIYLCGNDDEEIFRSFSLHFLNIFAAGGIVTDIKNRILMIYRRKKWDLPKGKIESWESISDAALREVSEECGLTSLKILNQIETTYHIYIENDNYVLKTTYWFKILCNDPENIKPEVEEEITEVKWFENQNLHLALNDTFPAIRLLILKNVEF